MSRTAARSIVSAAAAAALMSACTTAGHSARTIELHDQRGFVPGTVTVRVGDTIVFDNRTTRVHRVDGQRTDDGPSFESGRVLGYGSWTIELDVPGTYVFTADADDPRLTAIVEVEP